MVAKSTVQAASGRKWSRRSNAYFWIPSNVEKIEREAGSNPRRPVWEIDRRLKNTEYSVYGVN